MKLVFLLISAQLASPVAYSAQPKSATPQAAASPKAVALPRPKRGAGIKVSPGATDLKPIMLGKREKTETKTPARTELSTFVITPGRTPDKLLLTFHSSQPQWELDRKSTLLIQLNTPEGYEIEPSVITRSDWPKEGNTLELKLSHAGNVEKKKPLAVQVEAAYSVCESKTQACRKTRTQIHYSPASK